jgi:hypothetical protein
MGVGGQLHAPAALPPGKRPGTHCIGDWVDPRAGLDGCEKCLPHRESIPGPSVQPVASRYTDYAIPAPRWNYKSRFKWKFIGWYVKYIYGNKLQNCSWGKKNLSKDLNTYVHLSLI